MYKIDKRKKVEIEFLKIFRKRKICILLYSVMQVRIDDDVQGFAFKNDLSFCSDTVHEIHFLEKD